jgi:hypothetical protein
MSKTYLKEAVPAALDFVGPAWRDHGQIRDARPGWLADALDHR